MYYKNVNYQFTGISVNFLLLLYFTIIINNNNNNYSTGNNKSTIPEYCGIIIII